MGIFGKTVENIDSRMEERTNIGNWNLSQSMYFPDNISPSQRLFPEIFIFFNLFCHSLPSHPWAIFKIQFLYEWQALRLTILKTFPTSSQNDVLLKKALFCFNNTKQKICFHSQLLMEWISIPSGGLVSLMSFLFFFKHEKKNKKFYNFYRWMYNISDNLASDLIFFFVTRYVFQKQFKTTKKKKPIIWTFANNLLFEKKPKKLNNCNNRVMHH